MKLLKGWSARLATDDFVSAVDLALCEAASRYTPSDRASFITYLFYFIKGELLETLKQQGRPVAPGLVEPAPAEQVEGHASEDSRADGDPIDYIGDLSLAPDRLAYLNELREACLLAMQELSEMEQMVLVERDLFQEKMTTVAKKTGYSRGHLFLLQKQATQKMRAALASIQDDMLIAA